MLDFILCIRFLVLWKYQWKFSKLNFVVIETHISTYLQASFLPIRSELKNFCWLWTFQLGCYGFCSLHQNHNSPKASGSAIFIDLSWFSNTDFSFTTGLSSHIKFPIASFKTSQEFSVEKFLSFFLASEFWESDDSKIAFALDSSR